MLKVLPVGVYLIFFVCVLQFATLAEAAVPALASLSRAATAVTPVTRKPNILLLLADDMGYNDSAIYQDIYHQTPVQSMPTLEAFAQEGLRFTRFYTESTCSSSRVALLTGQYAARNGFMPVARGISPDVITLPEVLKAAGYVTHLVGKWHAGEINAEAFPEHQGFDTSFGFLSQWMLKGPDAKGVPQLKRPTYRNPWLVDEKQHTQQYQGHLEDILTAKTVALIRDGASDTQPWFIYHAFYSPHTPLEPAERFAKKFPNTKEGKYRAMLAQLDDSLAQIFSALKQSGQWDNTIILFVSDNGSPEKSELLEKNASSDKSDPSEKSGMSNAPFSGKKAEYEEGGIRTTLVIKWQKEKNIHATRNDMVSIMDIYPSLAAAVSTRADLSSLDGVASLLPDHPDLHITPLFFLANNSLSVLSGDGSTRLIREWNSDVFTSTELLHYDDKGLPHSVAINSDEEKKLFGEFMDWRDAIRQVPVVDNHHAITGRDFLRAPINPSWALAFSFHVSDLQKHQQLLFQKNLVDVSVHDGRLTANVNGLTVETGKLEAQHCYPVVLSGEFYDRYSSVQGRPLPSRLHLIVDGKEVATTDNVLDSFANAPISEPTYYGLNPDDKTLDFPGNISAPRFFSTQLLPDDKPLPSNFDAALGGKGMDWDGSGCAQFRLGTGAMIIRPRVN